MNIENLENFVNHFLNVDEQINESISDASKITAHHFLSDELMKSFKLLSNPANSGVK